MLMYKTVFSENNSASMKNILILVLFLIFQPVFLSSQSVYEHLSNKNIYDFLDELSNNKVIELNTVIKPFSRVFIAEKLLEANLKKEGLNPRQQKELVFYLEGFQPEIGYPLNFKRDYLKKSADWALSINPIGAFYKDSIATFWLKPMLGYENSANTNGSFTHNWGGLEFGGYIGKHLAIYSSLRDNNSSQWLIKPAYFIQDEGVPVKNFGSDGVDYSEARGGITYSWNWGTIGLIKDHVQWGDNYYGANIISGRTPSFGMIKLSLTPTNWFEFNYFHGWLVSSIVDSSRSYWDDNSYRAVFYPKYMAANMFTFKPFSMLHFSLGNSIVYSDIHVQVAYLIPFLFYKSVDHTLNSTYQYGDAGQNSQMFFDISSRNIKHLHLFGSLFVDELSLRFMFDPNKQSNLISYKLGARLSDFPLENIWLSAEYTRSNPLVYQNYLSTVTFESNHYNLGHYLRDNSDVFNIGIGYKPIRGLQLSMLYSLARHGNNFDYKTIPTNQGLKFMENVIWKQQQLISKVNYEIVNNTLLFFIFNFQNVTGNKSHVELFTPEFYWGRTSTTTIGMNIGF